MSTMNQRLSAIWTLSIATVLTAVSASGAYATPLNLSEVPLFLTTGVKPNLIMAIDDSGSMDNEVLLATNDGAAWWRTNVASGTCDAASGRSFVGCAANGTTDLPVAGKLNFNNTGDSTTAWKKYVHLFPNGCDSSKTSFKRRLCDSTNDHFAIPPLPNFAWARSPVHNSGYFDPTVTYKPWPDGGGYTFGDALPTAARFDPVFGAATDAMNLTFDRAGSNSVASTAACSDAAISATEPAADNYFKVYTGMTIPAGTCIRVAGAGGTNNFRMWATTSVAVDVGVTTGVNAIANEARVAIRYFPARFYLSAATELPANYGYTATPLSGKAPNGTNLLGYDIKPANFSTTANYTAAIQNFANWFTYYRKRHLALRAGLGQSFDELGGMRIAGFRINEASATAPNVTMRDIDIAANKTALYTQFYSDWTGSGGTPNRPAVANIVRNLKRTGASAPIQYECQKNFGMLFTDGFSNPDATAFSVGNKDGSQGAPYADAISNTMADGAMDAYLTNLRPDLPVGKLNLPTACSITNPDPRLDCNRNLHMNFFAVTLGTRGLQFNPDTDPAVDPYVTQPVWPTSFPARHPSAVDDLWHATINGRGALLNAKSPDEISTKLSAVLRSIVERTSSASSASVNSGSISSDTNLYQARFDSSTWTGELLAYEIIDTGEDIGMLGALRWNAANEIPAVADRTIITRNANGTGVAFNWSALDATRKLQIDPTFVSDATLGTARVNYLRGDQTYEVETDDPDVLYFRPRTKLLGDIVSSAPIFVGGPRFAYRDNLESEKYSTFRQTHTDTDGNGDDTGRKAVVYAGANDGMLHGFDALTGEEVLGFVPSPVFANLQLLTQPNYDHKFFVDGSPNMGDVFIDGHWETVLIGGLNKGGQGIYALKITDPDDFDEDNADDIILWEFTDTNTNPDAKADGTLANGDVDLGYTYSQPAIVKMRSKQAAITGSSTWAAVFGNGYNNTQTDSAASATGNAVLYIVHIETGKVMAKLDTKTGAKQDPLKLDRPNGLSTPTVVDLNGDSVADYIFAGDLFGNMWKFDVTGATPDTWKIAYGTADAPLPLFKAVGPEDSPFAQPITSRPEVIRGPNGVGMMVLFGTGKYLETDDKSSDEIQTFYGLRDRNTGTAGDVIDDRESLLQQTIVTEVIDATYTYKGETFKYDVRVTSDLKLNDFRGWYLDLVSPLAGVEGERQVSNPIVRAGRVVFTTLIPDMKECGSGGTSWLMELDALSGSRLPDAPFDMNGDGKFDENDYGTDAAGNKVPVSGVRRPAAGITPEPGVLLGEGGTKEFKYNPGTSGDISVTVENPGRGASGRQSWRQIR